MVLDPDAAYRALSIRDARFDGRLFVGVKTTGIYCRPICRVRTPRRESCRFFASAAQAEAAAFRPCLKCRPEIAPGLSAMDAPTTLATAAAEMLDDALACGRAPSQAALARRLGITDRHLRRVFAATHGVSPGEYIGTRRLLLAKQLLTDTREPIAQVALACGFGSLRRFNAAFAAQYRMAPSQLRRQAAGGAPEPWVRLAWRAPYDAVAMASFFGTRALPGVEASGPGLAMQRTLALSQRGQRRRGWLQWQWRPERGEVALRAAPTLAPALPKLIACLRHALDLDAELEPVELALQGLGWPGMRLPGSVDGFETAVRVVLGQQVSVAAARTLAARLVQLLGEPMATPWPELTHLFPTPDALARADASALEGLGIVRQRVQALQALARAVDGGQLVLSPRSPLASTLQALLALPGIGPWTAQMIALRVLAWPDAFPAGDIGVKRALGVATAAQAEARARAWQPWRGYAVVRLWAGPEQESPT